MLDNVFFRSWVRIGVKNTNCYTQHPVWERAGEMQWRQPGPVIAQNGCLSLMGVQRVQQVTEVAEFDRMKESEES